MFMMISITIWNVLPINDKEKKQQAALQLHSLYKVNIL